MASLLHRIALRHAISDLAPDQGRLFDQTYAQYLRRYVPTKNALLEGAANWETYRDSLSGVTLEKYLESSTAEYGASQVFGVGNKLVNLILQTREIPKPDLALFAKANKAFTRMRDPKSWAAWLYTNRAEADLLVKSKEWPLKGTSEEVTFKVGPLTVINQTTDSPETTTKALQSALLAIRGSGVKGLEKAIYGEVYFVGDINRKKTIMAQYYVNEDLIRILVTKRFSEEQVRNIIHEFGHRFWAKDLPMTTKKAWTSWDSELRYKGDSKLPEVGSTFIWGPKTVTVQKYTPGRNGRLYIEIEDGGLVDADNYWKVQKQLRFPTPYSARDFEEHFCEALSLFCLGSLGEPHKTKFEEIFVS